MNEEINKLIENLKEHLTLDGKERVFEKNLPLQSSYLIEKSDPEAVTKTLLIEPIIEKLNLGKLPEIHFKSIEKLRRVDYRLKNEENILFLVEAKPLNSDLFEKSPSGAVNQIKGLFTLAEVKENYQFGIATDGILWIFIDKNAKIIYKLSIKENFEHIKELLIGKEEVSSEMVEEEISKKFYDWYNALLHGGKYKDHNNKVKMISTKDCLVENILFVPKLEEREQIAQTITDRLIFIKFLQSKKIVNYDVLDYLANFDESILNEKLRQLFFQVLNAKKSDRFNVDTKFKDIPYLNGGLFLRTDVESKNQDYKIRAGILKEILMFLDSFKFIHTEDISNERILDPEILGYIFERVMTSTDRKGTGSFYTPKTITNYISKNTIYPLILKKVNNFLKKKGWKDSELLNKIEDIYKIRSPTILGEINTEIILNLKICDNACGSGAFLLSIANNLLEIYKKINETLRLSNPEFTLKKLILKNNLYGVDINPNAIEIAKLRLWLWLVDSYEPDRIEPLPNIDYNLRVGNSLLGYVNVERFKDNKLSLLDYFSSEKSLNVMLTKREEIINKYKESIGTEAREFKKEIEEIDRKIKRLLDINLYQEIVKKIKITEEEFSQLNPFHWGFEFYSIFQGNGEKGFDIIVGNPPYISNNNVKERFFVDYLREFYKTLQLKWDIYVAFIERSVKLIKNEGYLSYIVPDVYLTINYSKNNLKYLFEIGNINQIDYFNNLQVFRGVGVSNIIFVFEKNKNKEKIIRKYNRKGYLDKINYLGEIIFDGNLDILHQNYSDIVRKIQKAKNIEILGNMGYFTYGMRLCNEKGESPEFNKKDLVTLKKDEIHSKELIEGTSISPFNIKIKYYLEWNTNRVPYKLTRPTFKELYDPIKIIVTKIGRKPSLSLDEKSRVCDQSVMVFVPFQELKGVHNKSLSKYFKNRDRNKLEQISKNFEIKYLLAIMGSNLAYYILNSKRQNPLWLGPDEWKQLPIKISDDKIKDRLIKLVDSILNNDIEKENTIEKINSIVYDLYEITPQEREIIEKS